MASVTVYKESEKKICLENWHLVQKACTSFYRHSIGHLQYWGQSFMKVGGNRRVSSRSERKNKSFKCWTHLTLLKTKLTWHTFKYQCMCGPYSKVSLHLHATLELYRFPASEKRLHLKQLSAPGNHMMDYNYISVKFSAWWTTEGVLRTEKVRQITILSQRTLTLLQSEIC